MAVGCAVIITGVFTLTGTTVAGDVHGAITGDTFIAPIKYYSFHRDNVMPYKSIDLVNYAALKIKRYCIFIFIKEAN